MDIEKIKEKIALNVQERANLELGKLKLEKAEKERILLNKRRESVKRQTQIDHDNYILNRDRQQQMKNMADSPEGKRRENLRQSREILKRDRERGLTPEEIELKYMDKKEKLEYLNMMSNGQCMDIWDFRKQKEDAESDYRQRLRDADNYYNKKYKYRNRS